MKADNKTKTLQTDSNADIIFKQGDYIHTYVVLDTSGYTNGSILYLLDSDMNQLYSPYDVNANQIKTECTIVVGETDALQLPANYDGNEYTDFEEGTYNWKLKYNGNQIFEEQIIPITIKIQDFDLEKNLTPEIYPNEDIKIQLKTWLNTNLSVNNFDMDRLTTNASYDSSTGIITYPNSDINDLSIGEHTQLINNDYSINYQINSPVIAKIGTSFSDNSRTSFTYLEDKWFGIGSRSSSRTGTVGSNLLETQYRMGYVNGLNVHLSVGWSHASNYDLGTKTTDPGHTKIVIIPPGTYTWDVSGKTDFCTNEFYHDSKEFSILTTDCTLTLSRDENNIVATYMYNNETPIPNASIQILEDGIVIDTLITDNNGQCSIEGTLVSAYKAQAIDYDNSILLSSDVIPPELLSITVEGESTTILNKTLSLLFEDDTYYGATINWGDGTETVIQQYDRNISHTYNDGLNTHIISFSKGVKRINTAFANCLELVNVNIPLSVQRITSPFKNCSNLRTCNLYGKTRDEIGYMYIIQDDLPDNAICIIPQGTTDIYRSAGFLISDKVIERSW